MERRTEPTFHVNALASVDENSNYFDSNFALMTGAIFSPHIS